MILFPAVDVRGDRLVRLREGRPGEEFSYDLSPGAWASSLVERGAEFLHVIDLGAAFGEEPSRKAVREILEKVSVPVQVGGGIRSGERIKELLAEGARRVIVSTRALKEESFLREAVEIAGPEGVVVALDFRDGVIRVGGWLEEFSGKPERIGEVLRSVGIERILVTAIDRDGTFSGPDIALWRRVSEAVGLSVIGAGGIGTLEDLRRTARESFPALEGVVVGRALVEGKFTLEEAVSALGAGRK